MQGHKHDLLFWCQRIMYELILIKLQVKVTTSTYRVNSQKMEETKQREWQTIRTFFLKSSATILGPNSAFEPINMWTLFEQMKQEKMWSSMIQLQRSSAGDNGIKLFKGILTTLPTKIKKMMTDEYGNDIQKRQIENIQFVVITTLNKMLRFSGASEKQCIPANPKTFISFYVRAMLTLNTSVYPSPNTNSDIDSDDKIMQGALQSMCDDLCGLPASSDAKRKAIMQQFIFQNNMKKVAEKLNKMLCNEDKSQLYPVIVEICHAHALKNLAHLSDENNRVGKIALGIAAPALVIQSYEKLTQNIVQYLNSLPADLHLHTTFDLKVLATAMAINKFKHAKRTLEPTPEPTPEHITMLELFELEPTPELTPEHITMLELFEQKHKQYADSIQKEYMHKGKLEGLDFIHFFAKTLIHMGVAQPTKNVCCLDHPRTYSKFATQHRAILHPEWYCFMEPILRKEYKINFAFRGGVGTCLANAPI
jgi:hypothetical protein